MRAPLLVPFALAVMALAWTSRASAATYDLPATPRTVAWGNYDAAARPVLTIRSGDTVVFHTLLTSSPTALEKAGVAPAEVEQSLRTVFDQVHDRGPGGHILTGPVAIEGAEPGDVLEVRIQRIDLAIPYAYNGFRYGAGFLTDDFPYARMKIIPLDRQRMVARFGPRGGRAAPPLLRQHGRGPAARLRPLRLHPAHHHRRQHGRQGADGGDQPLPARPGAGRPVRGRGRPRRPGRRRGGRHRPGDLAGRHAAVRPAQGRREAGVPARRDGDPPTSRRASTTT